MSTDEDPATLAAGHALGSLTPEEEEAYQAYLAQSAQHRDTAAGLADAARLLRHDTPEIAPSADLKSRLMAQIAVTPQLRPASDVDRADAASASSPAPAPHRGAVPAAAPLDGADRIVSETTGRVSRAEREARRRWFHRPATIILAAAAAVVIFAGGLTVGTAIHPTPAPPAAQAAALAQITANADAQRTTAPIDGGRGHATLVWSPSAGEAVIVSGGMPAAPAGKTYQLWVIRDGSARSAGLMHGGGQPSWQLLTTPMRTGDTVGITIEPRGGSTHPTTKPLVLLTP